MMLRSTPFALALLAAVAAVPAAAQLSQSEGYKFLQAVKDSKNDEVIGFLDKPGATVVNARDVTTGEGALHIVIRRGDGTYLRYLLAKGADANLKDGKGETPLLIAARLGRGELMPDLVKSGANPNLANSSGETPLIVAVQRRDTPMVRSLLDLGADPDQTDRLQGLSARDYAHQDTRNPTIATLIDATPKKVRRAISGPKL
jgi:uncharacterized protein